MGFEKLAGLRDQLAKKSERERVAKRSPSRKSAPAAPSNPVDPVVLAIAKLQKRFPVAFPRNPAPKVPLKVGILHDLVAQSESLGLSEAELRDAMKTWCRGNRYWTCMVEGAARVDLAGAEAGQVSQADALRAIRLKARRPAKAPSQPAAAGEQSK
ncbi:ProP effector [Burkholderia multivorans]